MKRIVTIVCVLALLVLCGQGTDLVRGRAVVAWAGETTARFYDLSSRQKSIDVEIRFDEKEWTRIILPENRPYRMVSSADMVVESKGKEEVYKAGQDIDVSYRNEQSIFKVKGIMTGGILVVVLPDPEWAFYRADGDVRETPEGMIIRDFRGMDKSFVARVPIVGGRWTRLLLPANCRAEYDANIGIEFWHPEFSAQYVRGKKFDLGDKANRDTIRVRGKRSGVMVVTVRIAKKEEEK